MTRLMLIRSLYNSGLVLQLGHKQLGWYPLRWIGRLMVRRIARQCSKEILAELATLTGSGDELPKTTIIL